MPHPLADRFDGATAILAAIDDRVPDHRDHAADVRATVDTYHPARLSLVVTAVIAETATTATFRLLSQLAMARPTAWPSA